MFSNAMQFNEDHTPLWEAARQLKVPISFFSSLTDEQLIKLSGIFCETNVRSSCPVRGTTIRFQRPTTSFKWEDKAESACSASIPTPNFDLHYCDLPTTAPDDVTHAQGSLKRITRSSNTDSLPRAHCWALHLFYLHRKDVQSSQCSGTTCSSTGS